MRPGRRSPQAEVLVGSRRLLALFGEHRGQRVAVEGDIAALLAAHRRRIAPPGGGGRAGQRRSGAVQPGPARDRGALRPGELPESLPGVSSVQVAFARLGLDWADARIISAHGRTPQWTGRGTAGAATSWPCWAARPKPCGWIAHAAGRPAGQPRRLPVRKPDARRRAHRWR